MSAHPKYKYVSYYRPAGSDRWMIAFTVKPGERRQVVRASTHEGKTQKRAHQISDAIDSFRSGLTDEVTVRASVAGQSKLAVLVGAYERHLRQSGRTADYVAGTLYRLRMLIDIMGATRLSDITVAAVEEALASLVEKGVEREDGTRRAVKTQTRNHYLAAGRQYLNFLRKKRQMQVPNPFEAVDRLAVTDETPRRAASDAELMKLLAAVSKDKPWARKMRPADRLHLYLTAVGTGLRAGELRPRVPEDFKLDRPVPVLVVPASETKNRKPAEQPISPDIAALLRPWLATKEAAKPVFPRMPESPMHMFRRDLKRAGIEEWTAEGQLVFHGLRHTYGTHLALSGMPLKVIQQLIRHSDIGLTMRRYAHVEQATAADHLGKVQRPFLEGLKSAQRNPERDSGTVRHNLAHNGTKRSGDGRGMVKEETPVVTGVKDVPATGLEPVTSGLGNRPKPKHKDSRIQKFQRMNKGRVAPSVAQGCRKIRAALRKARVATRRPGGGR